MKNIPGILVVDDDANLRKTLSDILRLKNYKVVAADTGAEGVAEAKRAFVNVALIDLKLPDMSGIEVMERIKTASPNTEAIILTGHASLTTAIESVNKGAYSYLLKPYEIENLLLHIRHALGRQQAQEEIRRLASFPMLNPQPVIELALSGEVTYTNPAADKQFPDLRLPDGQNPLFIGLEDIYASFRQDRQTEMVREVVIGESIYEEHFYYVSESELIRITVLNITERKKSENKLRLTAQLLDSSADSIMAFDLDGNFIYLNEAAWKTRGYTRDELMAMNLHVLDVPAYAKFIEVKIAELMVQGSNTFEAAHRCKDGSIMPIEVTSRIIESDGRKVIISATRDIAERKQAEDNLVEQLEELRRWHDTTLGREGRILELKHEVNELLGKAGLPLRYPSAES